ncbi:MAG TPA: cutinase family protein [Candidatus Binatia bacterium]|nr:cutinase family protein [Candidatus Binatia bacterium]
MSASTCVLAGFSVHPARTATQKCPDILVIDMHGSGYQAYWLTSTGGSMKYALQVLLKPERVSIMAVPFAAVGGPTALLGAALKAPASYYKSVTRMKNWLRSELVSLRTRCPDTKVILEGHSQGAQAAGDVYQERHWPNVAAVVLFGDPYYNHADSSDRFGLNVSANRRIKTKLDGALGTRRPFNNKAVLSFCHQEDPICQAPLSAYELIRFRTTQHGNYSEWGETEQAAHYLINNGLLGNVKLAASKWPTNRDDGSPALFHSADSHGSGAQVWSSCSPNYCLVGNGDLVFVYQLAGMELVAIVNEDEDPHGMLQLEQIPEKDIEQLLRH